MVSELFSIIMNGFKEIAEYKGDHELANEIENDMISLNESLTEKLVKKGSKWQAQSEKGKSFGTYDTKEEAEKRLQQMEMFKHMNEEYKDFEDLSVQELRDLPIGSIIKIKMLDGYGKLVDGVNAYKKIEDEEFIVLDDDGKEEPGFNHLDSIEVYYQIANLEVGEYEIIEPKEEESLFVIVDSRGRQLSRPSPDDSMLWDRVEDLESMGRKGLRVVAYTGSLNESKNNFQVEVTVDGEYDDDIDEYWIPDNLPDFLQGYFGQEPVDYSRKQWHLYYALPTKEASDKFVKKVTDAGYSVEVDDRDLEYDGEESLNEDHLEPLDDEPTFEEYLMNEWGMTLDEVEVEPEVEEYYRNQYDHYLDHLYDLSGDFKMSTPEERAAEMKKLKHYDLSIGAFVDDNGNIIDEGLWDNKGERLMDVVLNDCKSVRQEDDFDEFIDYVIDNYEYGDIDFVDFLDEYKKWKAHKNESLTEDTEEEPKESCPKCGASLEWLGSQGDYEEFECPNCGEYVYTENGEVVDLTEKEFNPFEF